MVLIKAQNNNIVNDLMSKWSFITIKNKKGRGFYFLPSGFTSINL